MTEFRGYTIFCDDVRRETGNKVTLVGVYQSDMVVPRDLPITLPKLGLVILMQWPSGRLLPRLRLMICMPGDADEAPSFAGELELSPKEGSYGPIAADVADWQTVRSEILLSPVAIKQEGYVRVRAEVEGKVIGIGALRIRKRQEDGTKSPAGSKAASPPSPRRRRKAVG